MISIILNYLNKNKFLLSVVVAFASLSSGLSAQTIVVDNLQDESDGDFSAGDLSLREAIEMAEADGGSAATITFSAAFFATGDETIRLSLFDTGQDAGEHGNTAFIVGTDITIQGPAGDNGLTIERTGNTDFRLFHVLPAGTLSVENVTLANGAAKGGNGGTNSGGGGGAAGVGGAILNEGGLTLTGVTLTENSATGGDGGRGNSSQNGAGGGGGTSTDGGNGQGNNFGSASGQGAPGLPEGGGGGGGNTGPGGNPRRGGNGGSGGLFGGGGGGGQATTTGGGTLSAAGGNGGNGGFGAGGGGGGNAFAFNGPETPGVGGTSGFGAGAATGGGTGETNNGSNSGSGGSGAGLGGAIFNEGGTVTLTNSTVSGNSTTGGANAGNGGGGSAFGGGIFNHSGTVTTRHCTIANNTTTLGVSTSGADGTADGGGVYNLGDGAVATLTLDNTIVARSNGATNDVAGSTTNSGTSTTNGTGNLIEANSGFTGTVTSSGNPLLAALGDNRGPTPTHSLLAGSPALDSGDPAAIGGLTNDQRGSDFDRVEDGDLDGTAVVDIGAVEEVLVDYGDAQDLAPGTGLASVTLPVDPKNFRISVVGNDAEVDPTVRDNFSPSDSKVAYNATDNEFLVVYRSDHDADGQVDNETEVFGQRVNADTGALIGSQFRISLQGGLGTNASFASNPDVEWNSNANQYLVTWYGDDATVLDGDFEVWGRLVNGDGTFPGAPYQISEAGGPANATFTASSPTSVAYSVTSDEYMVTWRQEDNTSPLVDREFEVAGRRLAGDGTFKGAPFRISVQGDDAETDPAIRDNFFAADCRVEWNSTDDRFMVTWYGDDNTGGQVDNEFEVFGRNFQAGTGAPLAPQFRVTEVGGLGVTGFSLGQPQLAYDPDLNQFLVVMRTEATAGGQDQIFGQLVDGGTGAKVGSLFQISQLGPAGSTRQGASAPSVAYNPAKQTYLVTYHGDHIVDNGFQIFAKRVSGAGAVIDANDIQVSTTGDGSDAFDCFNSAVAYNPTTSKFLVTFQGNDDDVAPRLDNEFEIMGQLMLDGDVLDYQTLASDDGPRHMMVPGLRIGALIDSDGNGQQSPLADGDDNAASDDEDALVSTTLEPTVSIVVTNTTGAAAMLYGWVDANVDGVFDNATERGSVAVPDGTSGTPVNLTVPGGATGTETFLRLRLSSDPAAANPTGFAANGEVEDHAVTLAMPAGANVVSIMRKDTNPTNASSVDWDVEFSEAVTGVAMANFDLTVAGLAGASITGLSGSGTSYVVTADPGSGSGTVGLNLANSTGLSPTILNAPFSGGAYDVDRTPPTLVNLPAPIFIQAAVGETTANVFWTAPTAADDNDPAPTAAQTAGGALGSAFPIGSHTITYTAMDDVGNTTPGSFIITVAETRPTPAEPEDVGFVAGGVDDGSPLIRGSGTDAPGAPVGASFFSVNHAYLNNSGEILVEANLTGGPATENLGLWSDGGGGALQLVALESAASTGTEFVGTNYKSFSQIALNDAGLVGAGLLVKDGGTTGATDRGTFSELSTGTFTGGLREGSTAPGAGTAIFSVLQEPAFAEDLIAHPGQMKIDAGAGVGGGNDRGIWGSDGTTESLIIREGDTVTATGIGAGVTYGQIENRIVASGDDTIVFASLVQGNGAANKAIFAGQPGNLRLIAAKNDTIGGAQISSFAAESLNDAGDVAFRAILTGAAATNGGIFTNIAGTSKLIAREGDAAPGQPAGVVFQRFDDVHLINGGDVVFFAYLTGTAVTTANDGAIFRYTESTGTTVAVAREGDPAVSTDGAVLKLIREFDANAVGGVVFTATLFVGIGDATSADDNGLWLSPDASTPPLLQAREGDEFIYVAGTGGDPDDVRKITTLDIDRVSNPVGGVGSAPKVISDSGQAVIRVSNTLGGGAFLIGGGAP